MTTGPWRSVPTEGWTEELTERWLALEEDRLELDRLEHELEAERFRTTQAESEQRREMMDRHRELEAELKRERATTARIRAEAEAAKQARLAG